jgi:hypothetical protein
MFYRLDSEQASNLKASNLKAAYLKHNDRVKRFKDYNKIKIILWRL